MPIANLKSGGLAAEGLIPQKLVGMGARRLKLAHSQVLIAKTTRSFLVCCPACVEVFLKVPGDRPKVQVHQHPSTSSRGRSQCDTRPREPGPQARQEKRGE